MLAERAFEISKKVLHRSGIFVCKVFQGSDFPKFVDDVKNFFNFVKLFKPQASRKKSAEIYLIAKNPTLKQNPETSKNE